MDSIFNFIKDLPTWSKIFICFTVLPIYIFKDSIGSVIKTISLKNIFNKKKTPNHNLKDLLVHDFFLSLNEVAKRVEQLDFSQKKKLNTFKRKMMIELIALKTISIEKSFKEILNDKNLYNLTSQQFKFRVIGNITALIDEYNGLAVDSFIMMGVSLEDAHYFVNSYESYRKTIIDSFVDRLESISISKQYNNNYERMLAMLEVLTVAVEVIPRDVKSLYFIINGRYDKYDVENSKPVAIMATQKHM